MENRPAGMHGYFPQGVVPDLKRFIIRGPLADNMHKQNATAAGAPNRIGAGPDLKAHLNQNSQ
jgi:hypothetical protein